MKTLIQKIKDHAATWIQRLRNPKQLLTYNLPKRRRLGRIILRIIIACIAIGVVSGVALFAWYFKDLPRPGELRSRSASESTILYDRSGKQIYDISGDERRI